MNPTRSAHFVFLSALVLVCAVLFVRSFYLPQFHWDPVGMAFWPRVLIAVLLCLAAWISITLTRPSDTNLQAGLDVRSFRLPALSLLYLIAIEPIGFLLATPPFLFLLALGWSSAPRSSALRGLVVAVVGTFLVFAVFQLGVDVELPPGLLDR